MTVPLYLSKYSGNYTSNKLDILWESDAARKRRLRHVSDIKPILLNPILTNPPNKRRIFKSLQNADL